MRKHPYIIATLIATLLAIVVWICVPKEYTAITKISDEYKEMDVAIGLNSLSMKLKSLKGSTNVGMNNVDIYCKLLKTADFARSISHKKLQGRGMTYGQYLADEDTIETIIDHIQYNLSRKQSTLVVAFTDRDAVIASQMLDSVTSELQSRINKARHDIAESNLNNVRRERDNAKIKLQQAQNAYDEYVDSHQGVKMAEETTKMEQLRQDLSNADDYYSTITKEYVRQQALTERSPAPFAVVQANTVPLHYSNFFVGYLLTFVFIALLLTKIYMLYQARRNEPMSADFGDVVAPWVITTAVWMAVLIGLYFKDSTLLNDPSEQFYISLALWLPIFGFSSFITYRLMKDSHGYIEANTMLNLTNVNRKVFYILLLFSCLITPLYVKKIMDLVLMFGTDDLMYNMRAYSVYGESEVGVLGYSIVINKVLLLIAVWKFKELKWWQTVWIYTANLLNTLAIMEKGGFFLIFFCMVFVLFQRKIIRLRGLILTGVIMVALFYAFNLMRAKEGSNYQQEETFIGFIAMYILSPPVAYCEVVREITPQFGGHTFMMIYTFLNRFGFGPFEEFNRLQEFVYVPVATNVYTVFQPFYLDFGQMGVAMFAMIYGIISGMAYRLMRNGSDFGKCMYVYVAHILVLQFFQENAFTVSMSVIQLTFFVYACTQKKITLSKQTMSLLYHS